VEQVRGRRLDLRPLTSTSFPPSGPGRPPTIVAPATRRPAIICRRDRNVKLNTVILRRQMGRPCRHQKRDIRSRQSTSSCTFSNYRYTLLYGKEIGVKAVELICRWTKCGTVFLLTLIRYNNRCNKVINLKILVYLRLITAT